MEILKTEVNFVTLFYTNSVNTNITLQTHICEGEKKKGEWKIYSKSSVLKGNLKKQNNNKEKYIQTF